VIECLRVKEKEFFMRNMNKARRLLLLSLDWTRPKDPPLSLGQASILANLDRYKIPVIAKSWAVNQPDFKLNEVHEFVMSHAADDTDLALGAFVWHEPQTQKLLNNLKKNQFPGRIILGGPQISYTKRDLENYYPQADVFIRGYGEEALRRFLMSNEEKPIIAGVHYAGEPDLGLSAAVDLEQLPSPYLSGFISPQTFIRWETQRGCPFRCAFCQHRESDVSMVRRQFNKSRILDEAEWITSNRIIKDVAVLDPTFNSGPHYLEILEKLIEGKYSGKLALQCRVEMVRNEFLDAVERLNKTGNVVLEFGLQTIHREEERLIDRPNNIKRVTQVFSETKKRNINTEVSLIFGLPNQTVRSFKKSVEFCKKQGVPTIYAYPLMLLRGTPLHKKKKQLGLIESSDLNLNIDRIQDNIPHVVTSPTFCYEQWCEMADIAEGLDKYNAEQAARNQVKSSPKMSATLSHTLWQSSEKREIHFDDTDLTLQNKKN
jgi:radical SAM superfamily enzyme YgiQ (UPF0313 family)